MDSEVRPIAEAALIITIIAVSIIIETITTVTEIITEVSETRTMVTRINNGTKIIVEDSEIKVEEIIRPPRRIQAAEGSETPEATVIHNLQTVEDSGEALVIRETVLITRGTQTDRTPEVLDKNNYK